MLCDRAQRETVKVVFEIIKLPAGAAEQTHASVCLRVRACSRAWPPATVGARSLFGPTPPPPPPTAGCLTPRLGHRCACDRVHWWKRSPSKKHARKLARPARRTIARTVDAPSGDYNMRGGLRCRGRRLGKNSAHHLVSIERPSGSRTTPPHHHTTTNSSDISADRQALGILQIPPTVISTRAPVMSPLAAALFGCGLIFGLGADVRAVRVEVEVSGGNAGAGV